MKTIKYVSVCTGLIAALALMTACQSADTQTQKPAQDTMAMKTDSSTVLDHLMVNNKKDPSCGMPVTAGISDTAHYKNNVLGFCSKECKDVFEKNPEALLAAADIKK